MVRVATILLIMTVLIQANMGSIFDQFNTPEKRDKNKMLMFLRGLLKLDNSETTKAHVNKRGITTAPTPKTEYQQIWDSKKLPDRSDKSKMLSYLRGLKSPNSVFSVYEEPKHHALLQINHNTPDTQNNQITQNANARRSQLSQNAQDKQNVVINAQKSDVSSIKSQHSDVSSSEQQANWDGGPATPVTFLQPAEHERDSDTCFWRGQQSQPGFRADEDTQVKKVRRPGLEGQNVQPYVDLENVGENLISTWECIQKKFYLSYEKLKAKICGMLYDTPEKPPNKKG